MSNFENEIKLISKKLSYIISIKNSSINYTSKKFDNAAEALDAFISLIDKREDLIEKCKNIDIKLKNSGSIDEIKQDTEYATILNDISSNIKEIISNEEIIKNNVATYRKGLSKDMIETKNSQKLYKKYFSSPDMVEGYFLNKRQ